MKTSTNCFKITTYLSAAIFLFLLLDLWFFKITGIFFDSYTTLFVFAFIGFLLLPFMDKIKLGNLLELQRLNNEIKVVKNNQFLGEVIKTTSGEIAYYDSEGKHIIPDNETVIFMKSNKGEINISQEDFDKMPKSYKLDSVLTSPIYESGGHVFVILNNKKYHVGSGSFLVDWNKPAPYEKLTNEKIKLYPTGR